MAKDKKPTGETSTPLLIALVFFVITTLGLGYLTYDFSNKVKEANEGAKKEKGDADNAKKESNKDKEYTLVYKAALGLGGDELKDLGTRDKDAARRAYEEMKKAVDGRAEQAITVATREFVGKPGGFNMKPKDVFGWEWQSADQTPIPPTKGLIDNAVTYFSQRQLAEAGYATELRGIEQAKVKMEQLSVTLDNAKKAIDARQSEIPAEIGKGIALVKAEFEKFKDDFKKLDESRRGDLAKKDGEMQEEIMKAKRATNKADTVTASFNQIEALLNTKLDPFQFDKPQGKIIRRTGNIVEIDLGSADNLRAGLTFSIMPSDTPQRGFEARLRQFRENGLELKRIVPKGGIEVVDILGANLAQCRINDEDSPVRDRILAGDLIYNAVWRKGQSEHIVLYGIFDLDGDGRDDIQAVSRELLKMGVIVEAYWDLNQNKWVGDITSQATLAIEGYSPSVSVADGNLAGKSKIISSITIARTDAKNKGMRVLRPRDFFPRIGYKAKLDLSDDTINQAASFYIRNLTAEGTDVPPSADPAKPKN